MIRIKEEALSPEDEVLYDIDFNLCIGFDAASSDYSEKDYYQLSSLLDDYIIGVDGVLNSILGKEPSEIADDIASKVTFIFKDTPGFKGMTIDNLESPEYEGGFSHDFEYKTYFYGTLWCTEELPEEVLSEIRETVDQFSLSSDGLKDIGSEYKLSLSASAEVTAEVESLVLNTRD